MNQLNYPLGSWVCVVEMTPYPCIYVCRHDIRTMEKTGGVTNNPNGFLFTKCRDTLNLLKTTLAALIQAGHHCAAEINKIELESGVCYDPRAEVNMWRSSQTDPIEESEDARRVREILHDQLQNQIQNANDNLKELGVQIEQPDGTASRKMQFQRHGPVASPVLQKPSLLELLGLKKKPTLAEVNMSDLLKKDKKK